MPAAKRLNRWQKASALLPLALLSGAWTTSLTLTNSATAQDATQQSGKLPDGTTVPAQAIKAPASVSSPGEIAPGVPTGSAGKILAGASANGIPAAALSAYQRAAQVIDAADKSCHIDWTLIAAIGRVESNHGRYGGNTLTANGVSRPGIYGIRLDGTHGTTKITDTDGGQYDNDTQYDRAIGAMQFIPSTWSVIGVDGDGDGKRNPQDIDDASLATAVYLCSGKDDLSSVAGQRSAVFRYNHSNAYVDLVLSIAKAYSAGDFSTVPTGTAGTTTFAPSYGDSVVASGTRGFSYPKGRGYGGTGAGSSVSRGGSSAAALGSGSGSTGSTGTGTTTGTTPGTGTGSTPSLPSSGGSGGTPSGSSSVGGTVGTVTAPVKKVTKPLPKPPAPAPAPAPAPTLTRAQATAQCLKNVPPPTGAALEACIVKLMG